MATLKVLRLESDGVTYADPSDRDLTVRFKSSSAGKSLSGSPVKNYATEVIFNDDNPIVVAGNNVNDAISIRLRVSGTSESMPRIEEILSAMVAQLPTWVTEDVFLGFAPDTAPVIPAAV